MPLTGEEIRANLTRFVAHWSIRDGYERGEAQTFLTELFACYGKRLSDVARSYREFSVTTGSGSSAPTTRMSRRFRRSSGRRSSNPG